MSGNLKFPISNGMSEKSIKIILSTISAVLFIAGLVGYRFNQDISYLLFIFSFITIIVTLEIEMYFRIQHNLDNNRENEMKSNQKLNFEVTNLKKYINEIEKKFTKSAELQRNAVEKFFWHFVKENRSSRLQHLAPKLFKCKSVLYIGARTSRADFLGNYRSSGSKITILEIHKPNADYFRTLPWISEVIEGDVTKFEGDRKYDVIFWWHGPEHIEKTKLAETLAKLESMAKKTVVLGCPWGAVPQGPDLEKENPHEKHTSYFDVGEFEKFGYKTDYSGLKDNSGSNIIAIKLKK